jgi:hypothetical protein
MWKNLISGNIIRLRYQYKVKISNRLADLENFNYSEDINRAFFCGGCKFHTITKKACTSTPWKSSTHTPNI